MDAGRLIAAARRRAGLSLRELAVSAGTSHSTLAAYEQRRTTPNVDTLARVLRAAGFVVDIELVHLVAGPDRGRELLAVLDLAERFPARHDERLAFPIFGRVA